MNTNNLFTHGLSIATPMLAGALNLMSPQLALANSNESPVAEEDWVTKFTYEANRFKDGLKRDRTCVGKAERLAHPGKMYRQVLKCCWGEGKEHVIVNSIEKCLDYCAPDQIRDPLTGICKSDGTPKKTYTPPRHSCPSGQVMWQGECKDKCTDGKVFDNDGNCICPKGKEEVNGKCVATCGPNMTRNPDTGKCECDDGYELFNGKCVAECPEHTTRNLKTGKCECDDGYELFNGKCVAECPAGQVHDQNGNCVCPEGSDLINGKCVGACEDPCMIRLIDAVHELTEAVKGEGELTRETIKDEGNVTRKTIKDEGNATRGSIDGIKPQISQQNLPAEPSSEELGFWSRTVHPGLKDWEWLIWLLLVTTTLGVASHFAWKRGGKERWEQHLVKVRETHLKDAESAKEENGQKLGQGDQSAKDHYNLLSRVIPEMERAHNAGDHEAFMKAYRQAFPTWRERLVSRDKSA